MDIPFTVDNRSHREEGNSFNVSFYGTICENTIPVHLGIGTLRDIKSRVENFKQFREL